jgi:hypothetical protein
MRYGVITICTALAFFLGFLAAKMTLHEEIRLQGSAWCLEGEYASVGDYTASQKVMVDVQRDLVRVFVPCGYPQR